MTNPLLQDWDTPYGLPPFDLIDDDHYGPAIDAALAEARAKIAEIAGADAAPTFENTIEALELSDGLLDRVASAFYVTAGAEANDAREALMLEVSPKFAEFSSEIAANKQLFARIETLWQDRESLDLTDEQARLLYLTRRRFVRSGALLEGDDATRLKEVMARLSTLGTQFSQNRLADEKAWYMELTEADMAPLPASLQTAARAAGKDKGLDGPVITTSGPLIGPFLRFSPNRALRQKAREAVESRGQRGGETDNRAIVSEILKLRVERAKLLGYDTFADFKLETEMAGTPKAVRDLMLQVWSPARAAAEDEERALTKLLEADGEAGPLQAHDWGYYAEKRRQAEIGLDANEVKPYLQLDRMLAAVFDCANKLFGLEFEEVEVPLYHADARAWNVTRDGTHMALFVGDYFARPSKRSGAWCTAFRSQEKARGDIRPIVVNVCSFALPTEDTPSLLTYDDARTLFHEFGHALHHILSDVTYASMSGTSVARDFVELPSQLMEHWLEVPEVLSAFATHHETGAPIPDDLRDKVLAANRMFQGAPTVGFLASALVDLELHATDHAPADPMQRQAEILADLGKPEPVAMFHQLPHFAHVFSGDGYSAGYYSYMWSEVMDADAFAAFEEAGGAFDTEIARKLEANILSRGGSAEADQLYTAFRGQMPQVDALLRGRGLAA